MHWWPYIAGVLVAGYFLTWLMIPVILLKNKPPVSTLAWIWAIVLFPYLGAIAYFLFGSDRLARKHMEKSKRTQAESGQRKEPKQLSPATAALMEKLDPNDRVLWEMLSKINLDPASSADEVRLLVDAQQFYPALIERIHEAKHHAHIEFFIFRDDTYGAELLQAMIEAVKRGIEVRLLLDQMGCRGVKHSFFDPFVEAGGKFSWFRTVNPLRNRWIFNLRNHRKIQIIDGRILFVGGMNVGKEYRGEDPAYGHWRDIQLELVGEAAAIAQHTFADDWYFATDEELVDPTYYPEGGPAADHLVQIMADGPDLQEDPIQMSIVALLNAAQERAWLTAGYFVPNEPLLTALQVCAARGVDTRLLISEKSDHPYLVKVGRSYYEELMRFGVRIYEYEKGLNHAKVAAFDSRLMMVGSANFDVRSMRLNFELNALVHDPETTAELERVLQDDYDKDSKEIVYEEFRQRPFRQRFWESVFRPLAPLL